MEGSHQTEITEKCLLLDENGCPASPGYCKRNLYVYNKKQIKKQRMAVKEWDFYTIIDGHYKVELNFFNISYVAAMTAECLDLTTGKTVSDNTAEFLTVDKYKMSPAADAPYKFSCHRDGRHLLFETGKTTHKLYYIGNYKGSPFGIKVEGERLPDQESLTTLTPFEKENRFFYTQKLNCIRVRGKIRIGNKIITLDPEKAFMTIDWGRGLWPPANRWIWSNGSGIVDGKRFGYEMTWGFGDTSAATSTAVFYDGVCHKLGNVHLENEPADENFMEPWHFIEEDGRLDLTLVPERKHVAGMLVAGAIGHRSDQVLGKISGFVILDDGRKLEVKDLYTFAERVRNGW